MKRRIQRRRASVSYDTAVAELGPVLQEEWQKATVEEINNEIAKLPHHHEALYLAMSGSSNFHA